MSQKGCYSGNIEGVSSYREGKVLRLQQWLAEQNETYHDVHFIPTPSMISRYVSMPISRMWSILARA